jgi:hypothetical protein
MVKGFAFSACAAAVRPKKEVFWGVINTAFAFWNHLGKKDSSGCAKAGESRAKWQTRL